MTKDASALFAASLICLMLFQGFMWLHVTGAMSRKALKAWRAGTPLIRRYFFLGAQRFTRNGYSKLEKKRMPNRETVLACSAASVLLHAALLTACLSALVWREQAHLFYWIWLGLFGLCVVIETIADETINRQYWKNRRSIRPKRRK